MEPPVKRMDVNWIAVLVPYEDGKNFEAIGNPFQVKGVLANAAASAAPAGSISALFCLRKCRFMLRGDVRWMT